MPRNRWSVVFAGVSILMCLGVAYSWGVFLVPIDMDMGWGRAKISLAVSILLLVFSVFMAVGGWLEKRIGPHNTAGWGGLLVGSGWILASLAHSPLALYLCYGGLAGIGTGLSYMPSISSGMKAFPEKKGLVTGLIVFGFGFGTAFLSPAMTHMIGSYGWRRTMLFCGLLFGLTIVVASRFLRPPAAAAGPSAALHQEDRASLSPREMMRTGAFKIMFLTYFMAMVAGMMAIGHLVAFSMDKGFSGMQAAFALTVLSIFNGAGRILSGYASDRWGARRTLLVLFGVIGSAMFALYHAGDLPLTYLFAAVVGLCFGGFLAVYPPLTADYFGRRDFAVNYGLIFIGYGLGCFLGPLAGGLAHDAAKSYLAAFYAAGALALLGGLVVFLFLRAPGEGTPVGPSRLG
ncbi:MAG: OFA family MFS transporter [Candidatus Aminicenantes bacterium]